MPFEVVPFRVRTGLEMHQTRGSYYMKRSLLNDHMVSRRRMWLFLRLLRRWRLLKLLLGWLLLLRLS